MTAPRSLSELANVILLVREATAILDLESSLQGDTAIEAVADNLWDLYNQLLDIRDDLAYCENDEDAPMMVTQREIAAYRIVCSNMRLLYFP